MSKKILIIGDVHGRSFWKESVNEALNGEEFSKVVFLGDYLDPYPDEWGGTDVDYRKIAIEGFKEIIELKKANPDRIVLLIGNHDGGYFLSSDICSCRRDRENYVEIKNLFEENKNLFQLAYEETINDKHFIFSHAGISKLYAEHCFGDIVNENNVVDMFNNAYETDNYGILDCLGMYDRYRGWGGSRYASLVWADITEFISDGIEAYGVAIVGHTRMKEALNIDDKVYCLDCQQPIIISEDGSVTYKEEGKKIITLKELVEKHGK